MTLQRINKNQRNTVAAEIFTPASPERHAAFDADLTERANNGTLNRRERRHRDKFLRQQLKADKTLSPEQKAAIKRMLA